ncbi:MAG: hypothetical protein JNJ49_12475 [Bdellovibrionaceae bacterium]|nr:hypothetical protein [Pseudobdellovibrionaceae bacterium]
MNRYKCQGEEEMRRSTPTPRIQKLKTQYTRTQILESLIYEIKPFALAIGGVALSIHFTEAGQSVGKFFAVTMLACGVFIVYSRMKARGLIH